MTVDNKPAAVDLDIILCELGQFGKYQIITYVFIILPIAFASMYNNNFVFSAEDVNYRCHVPQCESSISEPVLEAEWLSNAMPFSGDVRRCSRYAPIDNTTFLDPGGDGICSSSMFNKSSVVECEQWVFGEGQSIVREFGIQCQFWKRTLVGTVHSFGLLFGLPFVGFVSDRFGRRVAFICSACCAGFFGVCRSFANSYTTFLIFEFLDPAFGSGVYSSGFILGMELVGPKRRVLGATILCMFYSFGAMMLGTIAWLTPYWRTFLRVIYGPSLLFVFYFWIINESVRWLISKERYEAAITVLKKAAKINGVTLTEKSMESLYSNVEIKNDIKLNNLSSNEERPKALKAEVPKSSLKQVLHSPIILCRIFKCSCWWITCTFVYYGLSINSVSLAGNIYLNYILVSLVELPAYFTGYLVLDRFGRKYTLCFAFLTSGIACIAFPFLPKDIKWLLMLTYLLGKYCITIAFSSLYVYTSELFPTPLRHSLLGSCSMIGRIGSIIAPQTPLLAEYLESLPSLLFGSFSFVSGLLMISSPETLNIKLPDTIEEAENISKNYKKKTKENETC